MAQFLKLPGPFASPSSTLPSLNITALWYSGITYEVSRHNTDKSSILPPTLIAKKSENGKNSIINKTERKIKSPPQKPEEATESILSSSPNCCTTKHIQSDKLVIITCLAGGSPFDLEVL